MNYLNAHFDVDPNPQAKVYASHGQASCDVWTLSDLRISENEVHKASSAEDVENQICSNKPNARSNVGETEEHSECDNEIETVLKVSPFTAIIDPLRVPSPQHLVVDQIR